MVQPFAARFVCEDEYLRSLRASFDADDAPMSGRDLPGDDPRRAPFLAFDDLAATRLTAWGAGEVAGLIARRHGEDLPTLITSNLSLEEIASALDARTASRLAEDRQVFAFPAARDLRITGTLRKVAQGGPTDETD